VTEPPEIVIPPRDWGDDDDDGAPARVVILVSSRDGKGDPGPALVPTRCAPWRNMVGRAVKAGWSGARLTYALADLDDQYYKNGNLKKAGHYVHTIALRCGPATFAVWRVEHDEPTPPGEGWSFSTGFVKGLHYGARSWVPAMLAGAS
jgi:hypothetical protein